jgi:hypothetical protein
MRKTFVIIGCVSCTCTNPSGSGIPTFIKYTITNSDLVVQAFFYTSSFNVGWTSHIIKFFIFLPTWVEFSAYSFCIFYKLFAITSKNAHFFAIRRAESDCYAAADFKPAENNLASNFSYFVWSFKRNMSIFFCQ